MSLCFCVFLVASSIISPVFAQIDEARQAVERGEYVRAANILSQELTDRPSPDAYLYLGIAYRGMKEYAKSEDLLKEGSKRYPDDARFHIELAKLFLENNDIDATKAELRNALAIDPNSNYASDELATIDMSEGDVQSALRAWNKSGRPFISDILHNYYLSFGSPVIRRAIAFHPAGTLRYNEWKTTEARLFETENFSNVGLEVEPTPIPDQYNAVLLTTRKTNTVSDFAFNLVKGFPFETTYLDLWNAGNTGLNFNGNYRWDTNRRRAEGLIKFPLPVAGLLFVEVGNTWRSERWNVSRTIEPEFRPESRFDFKANTIGVQLTHIPNYRVEFAAGFEYSNRAASGNLPQLFTNSLNTGKVIAATNLRLADGQYQNRLHLEAFSARPAFFGNTRFNGGVAELNNRLTLSKDSRTYFDWAVKGGSARGALPIEEYFVLGVDIRTTNLLRGHRTTDHGKYGNAPIGSDFILVNTDVERRLARIPFFNSLNIPYITVKWELFFDGAKTWDRNGNFQPSKLLLDTGGALRLETPTHSLNFGYGRALREGTGIFFAYYERRIW